MSVKRQGSARFRRSLLSRSLSSPPAPRPLVSAQLCVNSVPTPVPVFIDSGSDTNFIDKDFAHKLKIQASPLYSPFQIHSLNDQLLHHVVSRTQEITLSIDNHSEQISFLIIHSPHHPVVLGIPWLEQHNLKSTGRWAESSSEAHPVSPNACAQRH